MPRNRNVKTRLWANSYNWMVQELRTDKDTGEEKWTPVRYYHSVENLAQQEMEQKARYRVQAGQDISAALRYAASEMQDSLAELLTLVRERTVEIPSTELNRTRRRS